MVSGPRMLLRDATTVFLDDVRDDPYLGYILALAVVLMGFWFWYRVPNFATPDEYGRLLRPMKAAGYFVADPSIASFARGATDGVAQGATFYLYGLTLLPVLVLVVLTGRLGDFAALGGIESRWTLWHAVPAWFWTASVALARLANVLFAVAAVYVVYRIGTQMHGRREGRMAALLSSLTLGLIASAHEANEDTVMLLLLLATLHLSIRYVRTGDRSRFLAGTFLGGLAIAFKLTAGVAVVFLGVAFLLRAYRSPEWPNSLVRPRLLGSGLVTGVAVIYVGRPNVLFSGPGSLLLRITGSLSSKSQPYFASPPPFFMHLFGFLDGLGLPLFLASAAGLGWALAHTWRRRFRPEGYVLVLAGLAVYLAVFSRWGTIKTHHLLPTFPLLVLLLARPLVSLLDSGRVGRALVAALVASTALYAGAGALQYAADPRDEAAGWLRANADPDDRVVVYENSIADVGAVHGRPLVHYDFVERVGVTNSVRNESAYTEWMVESPDRDPEYIQVTARAITYTDPLRPRGEAYPERAAFVRRLVYGDHFGYQVAAEFGRRPTHPSYARRLLRAGIRPDPEKVEEYVLVLERPA